MQSPKHNPPDHSHEGRVYIEIMVRINDKKLTVGTTHLSYSDHFMITDQKKNEIDTLLDILKKRKGRYIFAGDLNSLPDSYTVSQLEKILSHSEPAYSQNSWTTKPFKYEGFCENKLNRRLDYIYNSKDINIVDSEILECPYSDHLPIQTSFNFSI